LAAFQVMFVCDLRDAAAPLGKRPDHCAWR